MNRFKKTLPAIRIGTLVLAVCLTGNGCFETEVAGTSTTTGNTISARAMLSDGTPAAGAKVSLRQSGFIPPGIPGYRPGAFSKDTMADSMGYFEVRVPVGLWYFLSVYAKGTQVEAYWRDSLTPATVLAKVSGPNDTVRLQKTGTMSGYVVMGASDSIWLGFPGTTHFILPASDGSFVLDSLPPGSHGLRVFRSNTGMVQSLDVAGWTVLSGATMVLNPLSMPVDTTIHVLSLPACLETLDSIVFVSNRAGPSDPGRIFRTVMLSSPPEWVELDACLGQWTRKAILPQTAVGNMEMFTGPAGDYLLLLDSNRILKLDSTGVQTLPTFPDSLATADFHAGRFYAFHHLAPMLFSFPDETAWLGKQADRSFPRPANFQRFAVNDSAIQYLISDSTGLALSRYDFNSGSFHSVVSLPGFSGACAGMAAGTGEDIWLLSGAGELHRVQGMSGQELLKARVVSPDSLRGLAGGE